MVFLSVVNFVRTRGADEFWRKQKIFRLAAHFNGRKRNCYSVTIKYVHRALVYATKGRKLKKEDMNELWRTRITAGCNEHGITYNAFIGGLLSNNILLNKKVVADLAIWEPKSFESLARIGRQAALDHDVYNVINKKFPNEILKIDPDLNKD